MRGEREEAGGHQGPPAGALLMRPEEAAALLQVGRTTVYGLIARKELRAVRIGRCLRVTRRDLEEYVEQLRLATVPPAPLQLLRGSRPRR